MADWKELQRQLEEKQTGISQTDNAGQEPDYNFEAWKQEFFPGVTGVAARQAQRSALESTVPTTAADYMTPGQIVDTGYGEYGKDLNTSFDDWVLNPDYRANAQSGWAQIGNGIGKMVVTAGTTFLDNTVGLLTGIGAIGVDAVNDDGFHPMDDFISNPFAQTMQNLRDWSEKVMPNYRTQEEQQNEQDAWWKNLNTANFWGDTFIKNLGFTIGAAASGLAFAKGFQALQPKIMRKAYKAALAAAGGDAEAEAAFQRVLQGGRMGDTRQIYSTFEELSNSYRKMNIQSQVIGGIGGAIGESRTEALNAAKEFRDEYRRLAEQRYDALKQDLEARVNSNQEFQGMQPVYDGFGNIVDYRPVINEAGQQFYNSELVKLQEQYNKELGIIEKEASNLANSTFWMNVPLLTASNMIMFGRMYAGGFKSQAKVKIGGNMAKGYTGAYSNWNTAANVAKNVLSEGMEEVSQKVFSEGSKDIAKYNMASFYNGQYDKGAIRDVASWMTSMLQSTTNVLAENSTWEEFAIGALTGALGMPAKGGWSGGIIGGIQEGNEKKRMSAEAAKALNERVNDPKFKELWAGLVRHQKAENIMDAAIKDHDTFTWHGEHDRQLIGDVMMFARVGRLNELEDMIDSFANVTTADVPNIRQMLSNDTASDFDNWSDERIVDWIKQRANEVKRTINEWREFHDAIDVLSLGTTDRDVIDEMVYTRSMLQKFEDRYMKLSDEVIAQIRPTIEQVAQEKDKDGNPTKAAQSAQELLASEDTMRRAFGGYAMDIQGRAQDNRGDLSSMAAAMMDDVRQEQVLKTLEDWNAFATDASLKEKVSDLQKLIRSRQDYYSKLFDPTFRPKFEEHKKKAETVAEELESEAETKKADEAAEKLSKAKTRAEYLTILKSLNIDSEDFYNTVQEKLQKYGDRFKSFEDDAEKAYETLESIRGEIGDLETTATPEVTRALEAIADATNNLNADDIVIAGDVNEKPEVLVANAILNALEGNPEAQALATKILKEKLKDVFRADESPEIKPKPVEKKSEEGKPKSKKSEKKSSESKPEETLESEPEGKKEASKKITSLELIKYNFFKAEFIDDLIKQLKDLGIKTPAELVPYLRKKIESGELNIPEVILDSSEIRFEKLKQEWESYCTGKTDGRYGTPKYLGDEILKIIPPLKFAIQEGIIKLPESAELLSIYEASDDSESGKEIDTEEDSGGEGLSDAEKVFVEQIQIIDKTTDINNTRLKKFANGDFSEFPELDEDQKDILQSTAIGKLNELKEQSKRVAVEEDSKTDKDAEEESRKQMESDDDPARKEAARKELVAMETNAHPISRVSIYDIDSLKQGRKKKRTTVNAKTNAVLDWKRKHKVQEFIDSGALSALDAEYAKKGKRLPIYYIANPHLADENPFAYPLNEKANPKYHGVSATIMLAVEMNDENRAILKAYEDAGIFGESSFISVQEGEREVKYQVIGELWNPSLGELEKLDAKYSKVKENNNLVYDHAVMGSILPQYLAEKEKNGVLSFGKEGKWFVAKTHPQSDTMETDTHKPDWSTGERVYTTLNYVMSGRNHSKADNAKDYEKKPLKESLASYDALGKERHFVLVTGDGQISTKDGLTIPTATIHAPAGSLWMATQTANGNWSWTYVTIARLKEYRFYEHKESTLVKRFENLVKEILKPTKENATQEEKKEELAAKRLSCKALSDMFFLGSGNWISFSFVDASSAPVSSVEDVTEILNASQEGGQKQVVNKLVALNVGGATCFTIDEVIAALKEANYRFQVSADNMNLDVLNELIDAGVLSSEMQSFLRIGATVGVNFMSDKDADGKPVAIHPVNSRNSVARTAGENVAAMTTEGEIQNIRIGENNRFILTQDGEVYRQSRGNRRGEQVAEPYLIAQVKALAELIPTKNEDFSSYGGQRYVVEKEGQYTEMYEREIGGIVVRMKRSGKNGAILLVSDTEWNALMEIAKPAGNRYTEAPKSEQEQLDDDMSAYDEMMKKEEEKKSTASVKKTQTQSSSLFDALGGVAKKRKSSHSKTVEESRKEDAERDDMENCG